MGMVLLASNLPLKWTVAIHVMAHECCTFKGALSAGEPETSAQSATLSDWRGTFCKYVGVNQKNYSFCWKQVHAFVSPDARATDTKATGTFTTAG